MQLEGLLWLQLNANFNGQGHVPGKALGYLTPLTFLTDMELYKLQRQPQLRFSLGL